MIIEELNFSVRTYNCLKRKHIDTVEQLQILSDEELLRIRGFGIGCLVEVRQKVSPMIPGPVADDFNMEELCFRSGEEHMKEKVIAMLMDHQTCTDDVCHRHIVDIIRKIEQL